MDVVGFCQVCVDKGYVWESFEECGHVVVVVCCHIKETIIVDVRSTSANVLNLRRKATLPAPVPPPAELPLLPVPLVEPVVEVPEPLVEDPVDPVPEVP